MLTTDFLFFVGSIQENENDESDNNFNIKDYKDELYINMNFLGIDLSKVPTEDLTNIKALIIPILYVISSFISIRLSTNMNNKKEEKLISDGSDSKEDNVDNNTNETIEENQEKVPDINDAMADTKAVLLGFVYGDSQCVKDRERKHLCRYAEEVRAE